MLYSTCKYKCINAYLHVCMHVGHEGRLGGWVIVVMARNNLCRPGTAKFGDFCGMTALNHMYNIGHLRS